MTPQPAETQAVREIYVLLRLAAARRQPVAATYDGLLRLLCPHVLGRKSGRLQVFCYQFGGNSNSGPADGAGKSRWLALPGRGETQPSQVARGRMALRATLRAANLH